MIANERKRRELAGLENMDDDTQATTLEPGEAPTMAASMKRAVMYDGLAEDDEDDSEDEDDDERVVVTTTTTKNAIHKSFHYTILISQM